MADCGGAFSFVDRITEIEPRRHARGQFTVPERLNALSPCLVAEAVGQLAAWVAMSHVQFRSRPVAALARETRIRTDVAPGKTVDLEIEMEDCTTAAIAYRGWARVDGFTVMELNECVGPMLPMVDFDDPAAMRERFETLCGPGVSCRVAVDPVVVDPYIVTERDPGRRLRAAIQIPESAPFFADHFPRQPVFPATLLLEAQIRLAAALAAEVVDPSLRPWLRPTCVRDVKVRTFLRPGQRVEIATELLSAKGTTVEIALAAMADGKRASTARAEIGQWEPP
jgi:3-hydroxymyristoyl/3-hydroxydecanoyl-(acyl carrier protein) dehydratase